MFTEIACVIDRSGSMSSIKNDAIGGFNSFLKDQKSVPGEANLTLVLFDNIIQTVHNAVSLQDVPELTSATYIPRGSTALYDAVGHTIDSIGRRLDKMPTKPDKVIFIILTDGEENASKDYDQHQIAEMIKHQTEKYSWEFIFLAANQDAFAAGKALNIKGANTANFAATSVGTASAYATISGMTRTYRGA